ncbi:type II secretion system minor pseudopilin GspK [Acidovorax sp. SUPP950]|uniref:type II secretion system minor pseudopilin GspK n=1 Tax=Acidovorax sp. SUPP950 TaxID=511901 RepID=UPI0023CC694D|nr:type II secretion system minor pseudopilin GspK [Acidovorax sp. SUPP950]GKS75380.1 type II secretion system minor pseudopilin GspK [Acidovorax sp. SUPP950]
MTRARRTLPRRPAARGAALLAAMLTVTLVATFAAAAMWQQWRAVEVETAERARAQSAWILAGALDWSRLILREDAAARDSDGTDHLAEPWAVPLEEARLSTFLAADRNVSQPEDASTDTADAFLSGRIIDLQSRLNLFNLVDGNAVQEIPLRQFTRLFEQLGLPRQQLNLLADGLRQAKATGGDAGNAPLMPRTLSQLSWLGVDAATIAALEPYATVLPRSTRVNLNTASAQVLQASIEGLDMAGAQQLVQAREARHFRNEEDARKLLSGSAQMDTTTHTVSSSYYEVLGRLRLGSTVVQERSLVYKAGREARTLWRERGVFARNDAATATR